MAWEGGNNEETILLSHTNLFRVFEGKTECKNPQKALLKWVAQNAKAAETQGQGTQGNAEQMRQPWPHVVMGSKWDTAALQRVLQAILDSSQQMSMQSSSTNIEQSTKKIDN